MLTADVVIVTHPGMADEAEHQLAVVPGVRVQVRMDDEHITAVCTVPDDTVLTDHLERIARDVPAIVAIKPTFVREM